MIRPLIVTLALILLPAGASAASGTTVAASGTTLDSLLETLSPYLSETVPPDMGLISTSIKAQIDQIDKRRLDARETCRTRLRKASTTTRFGILSDCVVDDLLSQKASLDSWAKAIADTTAVSDGNRTAAISALTAEADALEALVDGVENRVYGSEPDLQKARQRLVQKYSTPRWLSLTRLRADRALHWTAWLALSLRAPAAGSGTTLEPAPDSTLVTCLDAAADLLLGVASGESDLATSHQRLDDGLDALASCAP